MAEHHVTRIELATGRGQQLTALADRNLPPIWALSVDLRGPSVPTCLHGTLDGGQLQKTPLIYVNVRAVFTQHGRRRVLSRAPAGPRRPTSWSA